MRRVNLKQSNCTRDGKHLQAFKSGLQGPQTSLTCSCSFVSLNDISKPARENAYHSWQVKGMELSVRPAEASSGKSGKSGKPADAMSDKGRLFVAHREAETCNGSTVAGAEIAC